MDIRNIVDCFFVVAKNSNRTYQKLN